MRAALDKEKFGPWALVTGASSGICKEFARQIAPGREGLFDLIKSMPTTLKYEPGVIVADGDLVIVHGRFSGFKAPVYWIAVPDRNAGGRDSHGHAD